MGAMTLKKQIIISIAGLILYTVFIFYLLEGLDHTTSEEIGTPQEISVTENKYTCEKDKDCLALAEMGFYEARGEDDLGVAAVMTVAMNRAFHEKWPNTVGGVINYKCHFSYRCDGSMKIKIDKSQKERMMKIAESVVNYGGIPFLKEATHYHSIKVKPYWSKNEHYDKIATIGNHVFYACKKDC